VNGRREVWGEIIEKTAKNRYFGLNKNYIGAFHVFIIFHSPFFPVTYI
jgi:hypothetical protein